jgi:hypothetical protein
VNVLVLLCSAWLGFAQVRDAQIRWSPPGAIYVTVVNRDLAPVGDATITVHAASAPDGAPIRTATANAGGHVEFRDLPDGSYMVRVRHPGHLDMTFGPMPVEKSEAPKVRVPQILAVLNPVLEF